MNTLFNGTITRNSRVFDYSGIWTRRSGGVDWKAIVRHTDVVCRPRGTVDDGLTDRELREVIRELVALSIDVGIGEQP